MVELAIIKPYKYCHMNLTIAEQLMHSTVRLECDQKNGDRSTGTGFFFSFTVNGGFIPVIITNKHVIENSLIGTFVGSIPVWN